jgi:hypothetical protein
MENKPKILYADKKSLDRANRERVELIHRALETVFEVEFGGRLELAGPMILQGTRSYDAFLTHFPYDLRFKETPGMSSEDFYNGFYKPSSDLIKKIRAKFPTLPIIVTTGATEPEVENFEVIQEILKNSGVTDWTWKTDNIGLDLRIIQDKINKALGRDPNYRRSAIL